jgi:hypothetical protein
LVLGVSGNFKIITERRCFEIVSQFWVEVKNHT